MRPWIVVLLLLALPTQLFAGQGLCRLADGTTSAHDCCPSQQQTEATDAQALSDADCECQFLIATLPSLAVFVLPELPNISIDAPILSFVTFPQASPWRPPQLS